MVKKPSDLNKKKEHKLTRRRVVELATAAGIPAATALSMTPDDVKASDSDQITVNVFIGYDKKTQVDADWYDRYVHARDVRDRITDQFLHRDGVVSVGLDPGGDGDNPHIVVGVSNDEARGDVPEREDNVRVETEEREKEGFNMRCDPISRSNPYPGGTPIETYKGGGTLGPQFVTGSDHNYRKGWSIAGHLVPGCTDGEISWDEPVEHDGKVIGDIVYVDRAIDIAYVERVSDTDPTNEVYRPNSTWDSRTIVGTFTESALADHKGDTATVWGIGSCEIQSNLDRLHEDFNSSQYSCDVTFTDQVKFVGSDGPPANGDSGALWWMEHGGDYGAVGSYVGDNDLIFTYEYWAGQGFSMRNKNNMMWESW